MAHVLIGWELGANRGHVTRILHYHDALVAAGHTVSLALQRIDGLAGEGRRIPGRLWQAPIWPRLLGSVAHLDPAVPATLGDILARLGLADPGALAAMIGGWDALLADERPDMIVADYAPALLSAARGRLPALAVGNGFDMPPGTMARFPPLTGAPPLVDEAALLAMANADLAQAGRAALATLPGLFAADHDVAAVLAELDPYAPWRTTPVAAPLLDAPLPPIADGTGDELFVYWPERAPGSAPLWDALKLTGLPVRVYIPRLADNLAALLETHGFTVERRSMPFHRIAARSRMVLSHGGSGFVTMALLVGLPQVVIHYDLEKAIHGAAVQRLGLGGQAVLPGMDVATFAANLLRLWEDPALGVRARAAAQDFRARQGAIPAEEAVAAVARLTG